MYSLQEMQENYLIIAASKWSEWNSGEQGM